MWEIPSRLPLRIPADFLGMCFIDYPNSGNSPVGRIKWSGVRLTQMSTANWSSIETSPGIYSEDALARLDALITFQRENDATVYFGLYGTPIFYAGTTPNPFLGDASAVGPWGGLGEAAHPTSLQAVRDFTEMVVRRYNLPGGAWFDAHGDTLGKGISAWETWNEPLNGGAGNSWGFYWGSVTELVDLCEAQFSTIKSLDPGITVTSPGFAGAKGIHEFLLARGGESGALGKDVVDAVAFHPYGGAPVGTSFEGWTTSILATENGVYEARHQLSLASASHLKLWISEWGVDDQSYVGRQPLTDWYAADPVVRYRWIARVFLTLAANGIQCVHPWHWLEQGEIGNSGNWRDDTDGVQRAYNEFHHIASGKTLEGFEVGEAGVITAKFSDGTVWSV